MLPFFLCYIYLGGEMWIGLENPQNLWTQGRGYDLTSQAELTGKLTYADGTAYTDLSVHPWEEDSGVGARVGANFS